jgi:hypothetical protein
MITALVLLLAVAVVFATAAVVDELFADRPKHTCRAVAAHRPAYAARHSLGGA